MKVSLAKATTISFFMQGAGAFLLLIVEMLLARLLGVNQFGIYSTVFAWVYLLGIVATLGLNQLLLRFVPEYLVNSNHASLRGVVEKTTEWTLLTSALIIALGFLLLHLPSVPVYLVNPFIWGLVCIPFIALSNLRQATIRGLGKFAAALFPDFILRPLIMLAVIAFFVMNNQHPQAINILQWAFFSVLVAFFVGVLFQRRYLPNSIKQVDPLYHVAEWKNVTFAFFITVGLSLISIRIDIVMLSMLGKIGQVGIYTAASRIGDVMVFALVSTNIVVIPLISNLYSAGKHEELQRVIGKVAGGIFLFTLPVILTIIIYGHELLALFGKGFGSGYNALVILMVGQFFSSLSGPVGPILMMTGRHRAVAKTTAISAAFNVIANLAMIPFWGMIGAAISTAASLFLLNLLLLIKVKRELRIDSTIFGSVNLGLK